MHARRLLLVAPKRFARAWPIHLAILLLGFGLFGFVVGSGATNTVPPPAARLQKSAAPPPAKDGLKGQFEESRGRVRHVWM